MHLTPLSWGPRTYFYSAISAFLFLLVDTRSALQISISNSGVIIYCGGGSGIISDSVTVGYEDMAGEKSPVSFPIKRKFGSVSFPTKFARPSTGFSSLSDVRVTMVVSFCRCRVSDGVAVGEQFDLSFFFLSS